MSRRLALIIGNSHYRDTKLSCLAAPAADVQGLSALLRDPTVGAFDEVTTLFNEPWSVVHPVIAEFFADRNPDDLLLFYFSGHGVLHDRDRKLFLAVKDTKRDRLSSSAIPARFIEEEMDRSRSRRQILVLDCCHSGAFVRGVKGAEQATAGSAAAFAGNGFGRVIMTATDAIQFAQEGEQSESQPRPSVFTRHLIQGLSTGEADADGDGKITLDELYDYVFARVRQENPDQTPNKSEFKVEGNLLIAHNSVFFKPRPLPPDLLTSMGSGNMYTRLGSVEELSKLLKGPDQGWTLSALEALKQMAKDDSDRVKDVVTKALADHAQTESQIPASTDEVSRIITLDRPVSQRLRSRKTERKRRKHRVTSHTQPPEKPVEPERKAGDDFRGGIGFFAILLLFLGLCWLIGKYQLSWWWLLLLLPLSLLTFGLLAAIEDSFLGMRDGGTGRK